MSKVVTQAFVLSSPQAWMFFTKRDQRLKLKLHKDLLFKCNFKMKALGSYMSVLYNFWQLLQPRLSWNIPAGSPISISHQKNASSQISKQNILWNFFAIHTHTHKQLKKLAEQAQNWKGFFDYLLLCVGMKSGQPCKLMLCIKVIARRHRLGSLSPLFCQVFLNGQL